MTIGLGKFEKRDQEKNLQDEGNHDLWIFNANIGRLKTMSLVEISATHEFIIKKEVAMEIRLKLELAHTSFKVLTWEKFPTQIVGVIHDVKSHLNPTLFKNKEPILIWPWKTFYFIMEIK